MSFLTKLFKKKAGGTAVGNIFRAVASTVTGGMLGSGKNKLPKPEGGQQPHGWDANDEYEMNLLADEYQKTSTSPNFFQSILNYFTPNQGERKPFDLGDYIKLPTVQTNSKVDGGSIIKIAGLGLLLILAFKFIGRGSQRNNPNSRYNR